MPETFGVYIHFPFCLSKCAYCNFASRPLSSPREVKPYLAAMEREIRQRARGRLETVYLGGGTPSLCSAAQVRSLLHTLRESADLPVAAEITLEVNPAAFSPAKVKGWRQAGVNRLSLGVQSTDDQQLGILGRQHTAQQAWETLRLARQAGFDNISCDLICGLPGQSLASFQQDLKTLLSWQPEHISLYSLEIEPDTLLEEGIHRKLVPEPDDDLTADMYEWARRYLQSHGLLQYELFSFSRPGRECEHNLIYWENKEYLGLGAAAHSYESGIRSWNHSDTAEYMSAVIQKGAGQAGSEQLEGRTRIAEALIMGLRLLRGIDKSDIQTKFGTNWYSLFSQKMSGLEAQGLIILESNRIRLNPRHLFLSNQVFREIL